MFRQVVRVKESTVFNCFKFLQENFSLLLKTLSEKLHAEGLTLTVAVCADPVMAEESYDFEEVAR